MRTGSFFASTDTDGGTAHQVGIFIIVGSIPLPSSDSPENHTDGTEDDGTADTHTNTDDDLLLIGRETRVAVFGVRVETWSTCRVGGSSALCVGRCSCEDGGNSSSTDGMNGGDNMNGGSCVLGRRCVRGSGGCLGAFCGRSGSRRR